MKYLKFLVASAAVIVSLSTAAYAEDSPVGLWKTFDDSDGQAASLVRIVEKEGRLEGQLIKLLPRKGHDINAVCSKCEGSLKNQPISGMKIVWEMQRSGDEYTGGKILDPFSGNTYNCKIKIADGKLNVRGFIGFSLLGRTQTWVREE